MRVLKAWANFVPALRSEELRIDAEKTLSGLKALATEHTAGLLLAAMPQASERAAASEPKSSWRHRSRSLSFLMFRMHCAACARARAFTARALA